MQSYAGRVVGPCLVATPRAGTVSTAGRLPGVDACEGAGAGGPRPGADSATSPGKGVTSR